MKTAQTEIRKVYYRRYAKPRHFCPAPGYNCPMIPLGSINCKGPDYEAVKIVKAEGCLLRGKMGLISWGLNLPQEKWPKIRQVLAFDIDRPSSLFAEILLAV